MKILLTGATGFLGKHLYKKLAQEFDEVWLLVRNPDSINDVPENVHVLNVDFSKESDVDSLPKKIDTIIHLAQSTQYRFFPDGMDDMVNINVLFIAKLLEYARNANCQQFIYTSTGSVYTNEAKGSRESDSIEPVGAYPVTKYCAELLMRPYKEFFDLLIFRPYFIFGPGQEGMLISNLISRVSNGEIVNIQGKDGGMLFCPTYVDDVVNVIMESVKKRISGTYNLASPHQISIQDAVSEIATLLSKEAVFSVDEHSNAPVFSPDLTALSDWYDIKNGFRSFQSGIKNTLKNE